MKFLREVQKNFAILGVCSDQSRINRNSVMALLIYGTGTSFSILFLFCETPDFEQYTSNIYITTALAVGTFCFINIVWKTNELFTLTKKLKKTIKKSVYIS